MDGTRNGVIVRSIAAKANEHGIRMMCQLKVVEVRLLLMKCLVVGCILLVFVGQRLPFRRVSLYFPLTIERFQREPPWSATGIK